MLFLYINELIYGNLVNPIIGGIGVQTILLFYIHFLAICASRVFERELFIIWALMFFTQMPLTFII